MKLSVWIAAVLAAVCLCGCAEKVEEPVEITLIHGWGTSEPDHTAMRQIYKDFEKENPDIRLNLVSMPSSDEVIRKADDMMAVGSIPDLIFLGGNGRDTIYRFAKQKDYAVDMMPYIKDDPEFAANIAPELLSYWTTPDGQLYTVSDVLLLSGGYWYNAELFQAAGIEKAPETWAEFFDVCQRLETYAHTHQLAVTPIQMNPENTIYLLDAFLAGKLSYPVEIDTDTFLAALDRLKEVSRYSGGPAGNYGYRDVLELFNEGKSAMYINGVWGSALIDEDLDVRYSAFPYEGGGKSACVSACLGYIVGNTRNEKKMDASIRFVKYMVSETVQKRVIAETQQIPANPNIRLEEYEDEMPRFCQGTAEVLGSNYIMEVPDNIWSGRQINLLKENIMDVLDGSCSGEELDQLLREP
ncbi:ABC transporter substrate-binding protein [Hungatella effluvii]|uniref:ABC transporter substrate-binding protein n=1 Tax=Hungatella effluvii TaxID=1096246 RepID=UPI0022E300C1|nr:ABC transporter substrate-binding protein [Hungatella effluvii]